MSRAHLPGQGSTCSQRGSTETQARLTQTRQPLQRVSHYGRLWQEMGVSLSSQMSTLRPGQGVTSGPRAHSWELCLPSPAHLTSREDPGIRSCPAGAGSLITG